MIKGINRLWANLLFAPTTIIKIIFISTGKSHYLNITRMGVVQAVPI